MMTTKHLERLSPGIPTKNGYHRAHLVGQDVAEKTAEKYVQEGNQISEFSKGVVEVGLSQETNFKYTSAQENQSDMRIAENAIINSINTGAPLTESYDRDFAVEAYRASDPMGYVDPNGLGGYVHREIGDIKAINPITGRQASIRTIERQQRAAAAVGVKYKSDGTIDGRCRAARNGQVTKSGKIDGRTRAGRALKSRR